MCTIPTPSGSKLGTPLLLQYGLKRLLSRCLSQGASYAGREAAAARWTGSLLRSVGVMGRSSVPTIPTISPEFEESTRSVTCGCLE